MRLIFGMDKPGHITMEIREPEVSRLAVINQASAYFQNWATASIERQHESCFFLISSVFIRYSY
jgi:hypothetical protein